METSYLFINISRTYNWRRVVVLRKDDHFFNKRIFEAEGIDIIEDIEIEEHELTYALAYSVRSPDLIYVFEKK
ncbi:unnamed protein product [Protopolystoma xenopodis]|uniref:Uncharacterized protein n=1 Tax=Protopolystoma xenopodis TaxID=117903 RepID=A0A3S5BUR1_9PLAT|nr:unnamed protein product [Protopolystoma xenopodis]